MSGHVALLLVILMFWIFLSLIVAGHASEQDRNPILWAIIVFILGIWGLFVYVLVLLVDTNSNSDRRQ